MKSEDFIDAVKLHVKDAAVEDTILNLKNPPGLKVLPHDRARSEWYNRLSNDDVARINSFSACTTVIPVG